MSGFCSHYLDNKLYEDVYYRYGDPEEAILEAVDFLEDHGGVFGSTVQRVISGDPEPVVKSVLLDVLSALMKLEQTLWELRENYEGHTHVMTAGPVNE